MGIETPMPMKLRNASEKMAPRMVCVTLTMMTSMLLGSRCDHTTRDPLAPMERAAMA